jgi:7-carboxy-7-deazaguanine synthase
VSYHVKEIFYTLQGEGTHVGRPAVLCRFIGCNLWNGRESDRPNATCRFCDTDFLPRRGDETRRYATAAELARAVADAWPDGQQDRYVVLTGGEPALQADNALVDRLHAYDFTVAVETNGTIALPDGLDWICVSPKAGTVLRQRAGDEIKLVYPQQGLDPQTLESLCFPRRYLQPRDGPQLEANTRAAVDYCMEHPQWRLSLQTHKLLGLR